MTDVAHDLLRLAALFSAGLILLAGTTADLYFLFLAQRQHGVFLLPHRRDLEQRPFGVQQVLLVLVATLFLSLPALFGKNEAKTPSEASLLLGPVVYALAGLLAAALGLYVARATFRQAFGSVGCGARQAVGKGLFYGVAVVPPVMLLSHVMAAAADVLGFEPRPQEVFDWLSDEGVSDGTRVCLMASAIMLAPVIEEVLFRGVLFPALLKARAFASAALLSGLYFALVHMHAVSLLPLLALSVAFSAAYAATGSLLTPIVMHAIFNATSLLLYLSGP